MIAVAARRVGVDATVVRDGTRRAGKLGDDRQIVCLTLQAQGPRKGAAEEELRLRIGTGDCRDVQRLRIEGQIVHQERIPDGHPPIAGKSRRRAIGEAVRNVGISETQVGPDRVEPRSSRHQPTELRKRRIDELHGAQIEVVEIDIEPAKLGEGREEDVEFSLDPPLGRRTGNVRISKQELRIINSKAVHRPPCRLDRRRYRSLPWIREFLTGKLLDEHPVDGIRPQVDVLHDEDWRTRSERHAAAQTGIHRAHVDIVQLVVEYAQVALVPDAERNLAAADGGEGGIHPRHVGQRESVRDKCQVVAGGQIASPPDFPLGRTDRRGEPEMLDVGP